MAAFPTRESDILMLTLSMLSGLEHNPVLYPDPPVSRDDLAIVMVTYVIAKSLATNAQAALTAAAAARDAALHTLVEAMKCDLRYAENTVHNDDAKLKLLGWGARATPTAASALAPPGQPRSLEAPKQGEGWLRLDWKAPADGGEVVVYKLQRRQRPEGTWQDIGLSMETNTTLTAQDRGKELEYRVSAVNKAGESPPSNTVMAVL